MWMLGELMHFCETYIVSERILIFRIKMGKSLPTKEIHVTYYQSMQFTYFETINDLVSNWNLFYFESLDALKNEHTQDY